MCPQDFNEGTHGRPFLLTLEKQDQITSSLHCSEPLQSLEPRNDENSMKDEYIDMWRDIDGQPDYCDEELYLVSDLAPSGEALTSILFGCEIKHGHKPFISIRVQKGSTAQRYAHSFLEQLKHKLNANAETTPRLA